MKDFFFNKLFSLRNLFIIGNFLSLFLFLIVLYQDYFREWKPYQDQYKKLVVAHIEKEMSSGDEKTKEALRDELRHVKGRPQEIKQILVPILTASTAAPPATRDMIPW